MVPVSSGVGGPDDCSDNDGYKGIFPGKVLCSWLCSSSLGRSHVAILNWFSGLVVVYSGLH